METLYTIGHSTHDTETFINILQKHNITAVVDVRSSPYSKFNPQFNRETIRDALKLHQITYVYLGKELGPRINDPSCYENGKVKYERIAQTEPFQEGLRRLKEGMKRYRVALMCAEKDPLTCHRTILICRHIRSKLIKIEHILEDGTIESHSEAENRLMKELKIPPLQLFESPESLVERAYGIRGDKIAFSISGVRENEGEWS